MTGKGSVEIIKRISKHLASSNGFESVLKNVNTTTISFNLQMCNDETTLFSFSM